MTDPTDNSDAIEAESLPIKSVDQDTATNSEHVLESSVEVYQEYEQRYDPDENAILIGPTRTEDKANAFTDYQCSCGAHFTDQTEATEHLINMSHQPKHETPRNDSDQTEL